MKNNLIIDLDSLINEFSGKEDPVKEVFGFVRSKITQRNPSNLVAFLSKSKNSSISQIITDSLSLLGINIIQSEDIEKDIISSAIMLKNETNFPTSVISPKQILSVLTIDEISIERDYKGSFTTFKKLNKEGLDGKKGILEFLSLSGHPVSIPKIGPAKSLELLKNSSLKEIIENPSSDRFSQSVIKFRERLIGNYRHLVSLRNEDCQYSIQDFSFDIGKDIDVEKISKMYDEKNWDFKKNVGGNYVLEITDPFSLLLITSNNKDLEEVVISKVEDGIIFSNGKNCFFLSDDIKEKKDCIGMLSRFLFDNKKVIYTDDKLEVDRFFHKFTDDYDLDKSSNIKFDLKSLLLVNNKSGSPDVSIYDIPSIYKRNYDLLSPKQQYLLDNIETPFNFMISEIEKNGISIDIDYLGKSILDITEHQLKISKEIENVISCSPNEKSFENKLRNILGVEQGVSLTLPYLKSNFSENSLVEKYLEYQNCSTIIKNLQDLTNNSDGSKIYPSYKPNITGRMYASNPAIQGLYKKSIAGVAPRQVICPSSKDRKIVAMDFKQIDMCSLAIFTNNEGFINLRLRGGDAHTKTATEIFKVSADKVSYDDRQVAKQINLGVPYGMGIATISSMIKRSKEDTKKFIEAFKQDNPIIHNHMRNRHGICEAQGFIESIGGRRMPVDKNRPTRTIGQECQTSSSEVMKASMIECYKKIKEENLDVKIIMNQHDELVFDISDDDFNKSVNMMYDVMQSAASIAWNRDIPKIFEVEVSSGENFFNLEEIDLNNNQNNHKIKSDESIELSY